MRYMYPASGYIYVCTPGATNVQLMYKKMRALWLCAGFIFLNFTLSRGDSTSRAARTYLITAKQPLRKVIGAFLTEMRRLSPDAMKLLTSARI